VSELIVQGRRVDSADLDLIRDLIATGAAPHRSALSRLLCQRWKWQTPLGRPKDIAARTFLRKLEQRGLIVLPERLTRKRSGLPRPPADPPPTPPTSPDWLERDPLRVPLEPLRPLHVERVDSPAQRSRLFEVLRAHHYLGFSRSVGENVGYLVYDSARRRLLAVAWFGAPAWKARDRDRFIGWSRAARERHLGLIANQVRFLILPWVEVAHLASHLLGRLTRRLSRDWQEKYGHPIVLVESFVDAERFRATCYRAANWIVVGRTQGRSRQDRHRRLRVATKLIALLPLHRHWRRFLQASLDP
jgi:hypothetical protein